MKRIKFLCLFLALSSLALSGETYYFLTQPQYGSDAAVSPLTCMLNGSFDMFQMKETRDVFHYPYYRSAAINLWHSMLHTPQAIRNYGTREFVKSQLLPLDFQIEGAGWWANYHLHLIGGGTTFSYLYEWYEYHNIPLPKILAGINVYTYHFMNEIIENGAFRGDNIDAIADLMFFDIGGPVMFSFEPVRRFFGKTLNLADWSFQPGFGLSNGYIYNCGQNYSIKWRLPYTARYYLFYYFGLDGLVGVSYKLKDKYVLSIGLGGDAERLVTVENEHNINTVKLTYSAGIFLDYDNSLLASVLFSGYTKNALLVNVYPGVLKYRNISPGFWLNLGDNRQIICGLGLRWIPGIAFR